jgi:hypothetical protein
MVDKNLVQKIKASLRLLPANAFTIEMFFREVN